MEISIPTSIFKLQTQPITDKETTHAHAAAAVVIQGGWGPFFRSSVACEMSTVSTGRLHQRKAEAAGQRTTNPLPTAV